MENYPIPLACWLGGACVNKWMLCHLHRQLGSANGTKQHVAPRTDIHHPDVAGRDEMLEPLVNEMRQVMLDSHLSFKVNVN